MPDIDAAVGETRKLIPDFLAPELCEVRAGLGRIKDELPQMEHRLMAAIKSSEEKWTLMFQLAQADARIEELQSKLDKQEGESTQ